VFPQLRILQLCQPLNFSHELVMELLELQSGRGGEQQQQQKGVDLWNT
jgi:hypothetical protein